MENLMATKVVYFRDILTSELGFELVFPGGFSSYRQVSLCKIWAGSLQM